MPAAAIRISALIRVRSSPLIRMPPVTPPPNAISEISRPVRPSQFFLMSYSKPPIAIRSTSREVACPLETLPLSDYHPLNSANIPFQDSFFGIRPQLEALDLSGRGFGQFGANFDPARIFVRCELLLAMFLQGQEQCFAGPFGRFEDH